MLITKWYFSWGWAVIAGNQGFPFQLLTVLCQQALGGLKEMRGVGTWTSDLNWPQGSCWPCAITLNNKTAWGGSFCLEAGCASFIRCWAILLCVTCYVHSISIIMFLFYPTKLSVISSFDIYFSSLLIFLPIPVGWWGVSKWLSGADLPVRLNHNKRWRYFSNFKILWLIVKLLHFLWQYINKRRKWFEK